MTTIAEKASTIIDRFITDPEMKAKIQVELGRRRGTEATVAAIVGLFDLDHATSRKYVESIRKSIAGTDSFHIANYHIADAETATRASDSISFHAREIKAILAA